MVAAMDGLRSVGRKLKNYSFSILFIVVGSVAVLESIRISNKYSIKDWWSGPSGFVMLLGCGLLVLAVIEGLGALRLDLRSAPDEMSGAATQVPDKEVAGVKIQRDKGITNLIICFVFLIVYVITIRPIGFTLATALYLLSNLWFLKNSRLTTVITVVLAVLVIMYLAPAAGLSLPRGILGI
jgi:hypothetical protein